MELIYPFLIAFTLVFFSELGDKTQLLVLSFSTKNKAKHILLGVAIGTFFSHGLAILFGSHLGNIQNFVFQFYLKLLTYITFLLFGMFGFLPKNIKGDNKSDSKASLLQKISSLHIHCTLIVAFCIFVGELGDKTFLASLGLGLEYPTFKIPLIVGCILGMVLSNLITIFFGKLLATKIPVHIIEITSNVIFILFGIIGLSFLLIS